MRLESIQIRNVPPVARFEATHLADLVVIAGPNGAGKTRLIQRILQHLRGDGPTLEAASVVSATSVEERQNWGKDTLELGVIDDLQIYRSTLQANRRRVNLKSSVLQFESDRTIQNLQPLVFTWDMPDPSEEEIGWDFSFHGWRNRWQDTVNSMYRLIEHQKQSIATRAVQLRRDGATEMKLNFTDPMEPFKQVFHQLLAPKSFVEPSARRQALEFIVDGQTFEMSMLSSGEREVVNIAFDFLLRRPTDCIVFFDEPELHLHPELSHRLLQVLQTIGARNQFVLSTHSPDIITASIDKSVYFLSSPKTAGADGTLANQAIPVSEDDETNQALRLLGHSIGIIALGRKIVLVEGESSSLDKEVYGSLIRARFPNLVLVPSGGKHLIQSFEALHRSVLAKTLWGVEFYMLCDRDSAPATGLVQGESSPRLRVLERYHLENYFLDEETWARAFKSLEADDHWLRDPSAVRARLRQLATGLLSYATAMAVASEVRRLAGNVDILPKDCHGRSLDELISLMLVRVAEEERRVSASLTPARIEAYARRHFDELADSLNSDTDYWKANVPGKPLLRQFSSTAAMNYGRMKNLYLAAAEAVDPSPFAEVVGIFQSFSGI